MNCISTIVTCRILHGYLSLESLELTVCILQRYYLIESCVNTYCHVSLYFQGKNKSGACGTRNSRVRHVAIVDSVEFEKVGRLVVV
jgi:hypothetical protein